MTLSEKETDAILQKVYYDPKIGLVSADRFYKKLKSISSEYIAIASIQRVI